MTSEKKITLDVLKTSKKNVEKWRFWNAVSAKRVSDIMRYAPRRSLYNVQQRRFKLCEILLKNWFACYEIIFSFL